MLLMIRNVCSQHGGQCLIKEFDHTIWFRMESRSSGFVNTKNITKFFKQAAFMLSTLITMYDLWNTKPGNELLENHVCQASMFLSGYASVHLVK
jgi:hypothetical protein